MWCLPLLCPSRSGRPTFFTAVFNTFSPATKQSWISSLQMAKLTLGMALLTSTPLFSHGGALGRGVCFIAMSLSSFYGIII